VPNVLTGSTVNQLQCLFKAGTISALSDGALLDRFANTDRADSELAFTALVNRHGAMVLRVCRGILRDEHDAEDAFQATFFILARRAHSLWWQESISPWLYGVAYRIAKHAQAATAKRRRIEHRLASNVPLISKSQPEDRFEPILYEEIHQLPERYRSVLLLCDLENLTYDQVARQLQCPPGTVKSRLSRARAQLARRLIRRGLAPATATTSLLLSSRAIPTSLAQRTARAATQVITLPSMTGTLGIASKGAIALAQGGLRTMLLTSKIKSFGFLVLLIVAPASGLAALYASGLSVHAAPKGTLEEPASRVVSKLQPPVELEDTSSVKSWAHSPSADLAIDKETKHGGLSAARFEAKPDANQSLKTMLQAFAADEYRGKRIRLAAFIKSQDINEWAGMWMRVDTDRSSPSFDNMMERPLKGTNDWAKHEIILDIPDDAQVVTFGMLVVGEGKLWVDDMTFEIVGKDVATTQELNPNAPEFPEENREQIKQGADRLREMKMTRPTNLTFEP
jgi:RNA polymerase sigma factor (sigma-70 family)